MNATTSFPASKTSPCDPEFLPQPAPRSERPPRRLADIKDWCLTHADEWYAQGERGAARDFLKHAAQLDPRDAEVWIALGSLHFELGEFEQAGLAFNRAGKLDPANVRVFLHLGLTHQQLGQMEEAEMLLRHAVALEPANVQALAVLGNFLMARERHAEAREPFTAALQHQLDDIEMLLRLGLCAFKTNDAAAAHDCYERVLRLDPLHALARENLTALNRSSSEGRG